MTPPPFSPLVRLSGSLLLLLPLLLIGSPDLTAQSADTLGRGAITGIVVDRATQEPLPGAAVLLLGTTRGTATGAEGSFRFDNVPTATYRVEVRSIGYEPLIVGDIVVSPARPQSLRIELDPSTDTTAGIVVRPGYFSRDRTAVLSTQTLRNEEIRRQPGGFEDVVRAISTLPGIAQVSNGRNDLLVRGGAPSENLYLIEGIESPNINHFGTQGAGGGPLSFVNLDFVEDVTFSSGGFGVAYGDKISSALRIDLRQGRTDRQGGKATISASQFGLNLEGPVTPDASYLFSARRSYLDLIFRAAGFSFVPEYWDFFGKADVRLGRNDRLSGLAIGVIDRVRFLADDADGRYENARILDNSQDQLVAGIGWTHVLDNGTVTTTFGRTRVAYRFGQADTLGAPIFRNASVEDELALRVDGAFGIGEGTGRIDLAIGGSGKTIGFETDLTLAAGANPFALTLRDRFQKGALYGEISRRLIGDIRGTLGARLDWFDGIDDAIAPSLRGSLLVPIGALTTVAISGGRYHQSPSLIWLAADSANRALRPIRTDVAVVGISHLLGPDIKGSLEGYVKRYDDYPGSLARPYLLLANTGAGFGGADDGFASFGLEPLGSVGDGEAYGVELFLQKKLSETPWFGTAALSLNRATFTALDGVPRPSLFDQRVIASLSGGWKIDERWEVGVKFRFATGRPYTPVDSTGDPTFGYQVVDRYNALRLPASHQLDLRIDRRWPIGDWSLITYIDVQNVYNAIPPSPPRWDARTRSGVTDDGIGILPSIGVSAEW